MIFPKSWKNVKNEEKDPRLHKEMLKKLQKRKKENLKMILI